MKTLLALAISASLMGCSTTNQTITTPAVALMAGNAAELGTVAWLANHPGDRPTFEAVQMDLDGMDGRGDYGPADFATVLQKLPIKQLRGNNSTLVVSNPIIVYDEGTGRTTKIEDEPVAAVTLHAVASGLKRGLRP